MTDLPHAADSSPLTLALTACTVRLAGGCLSLGTGAFTWTMDWRDGRLATRELRLTAGGSIVCRGDLPDLEFPGTAHDVPVADAVLVVRDVAADGVRPAQRLVQVSIRLDRLEVRRTFRLVPGCPAIAVDVQVRGVAAGPWRAVAAVAAGGSAGDLVNIERLQDLHRGTLPAPGVLRLRLPAGHRRVRAVRFRDITDRRNNLVEPVDLLPYRQPSLLHGNLLFVTPTLGGVGLFVVREAPCSDVQLADPGYDFLVSHDHLRAVGVGLDATDLDPVEWRRAYGVVLGVAAVAPTGDPAADPDAGLLAALRQYQGQRRALRPDRDDMVLLNTWGDRGQDSRLGEAFALRELEAAARLGVSHFQLDDGWQAGQSSNSASAGGSLAGIWQRPDYWHVHPTRFPRGLGPVLARARELGIELCLWFNPSADDSYGHWRDDAATLIGLYREHGVRTFKIDGVKIPDPLADRQLRAMFDAVVVATGGEVVFNLDVTAGRRWGYNLGVEYGNLFVENRYTDWSNYYPHWTLRNLWQLARYVPPQILQMEFLNTTRNPQAYAVNDPLRPQNVPMVYAFALTMAAQPLAWFEAQHLPADVMAALAPVVRAYRAIQAGLHAAPIYPIGREPDGTGFTGFQSVEPSDNASTSGYLLFYREYTTADTARLPLWNAAAQAGRTIELTHCFGAMAATADVLDADGRLRVSLPTPFSFAVYRYTLGA